MSQEPSSLKPSSLRLPPLFEFLFCLLLVSFFLTVGTDYLAQIRVRMGFAAILFAWGMVAGGRRFFKVTLTNTVFVFFLVFLGFEVARALFAAWQLESAGPGIKGLLLQYQTAPLKWIFYVGVFAVSLWFLKAKQRVIRLAWAMAGAGFFLAINIIFPLLQDPTRPVYLDVRGVPSFFHPIFYSLPVLGKYVFAHDYNSNHSTDVILIGFFATLGLLFYRLYQWMDPPKEDSPVRESKGSVTQAALLLLLSGVTALSAFLLNSRGAVVSFGAAFLFFMGSLALKYRTKVQGLFSLILLISMVGFFVWAGRPQAVWKELRTLQGETDPGATGSIRANREGAFRARAIYKAHPFWGVGTDGYGKVSEQYASPEALKRLDDPANVLVRFKVMNHYLQILAEEGAGAWLYFAFIGSYLVSLAVGLWKAKSRFQFILATSFGASVLMVLTHATINYLMQQFSVAFLVYALMGASLGILRRDFEH